MNNLNKFGLPAGLGGNPNAFSRPAGVYQAPTDFVELPSKGKFYPKDSPLHGIEQLEVRFMTAREEDLLVSPGLQKAGLAIDRVIESLLVDKSISAKELLIGDKNAILMNIRKNAFGDEYEFSYACERCGNVNKHKEYFSNLTIKEILPNDECSLTENGTILVKLPKTGATVELKFLKGEDELAIDQIVQKRTANNLPPEALLTRYRYMFVSVNGNSDQEQIISFINSLPIMDSRFLRLRYSEMNPDVAFEYSSDCKKCGHTNKGGVPITVNFFWPEL